MFSKILVANRGEIAVRVIRACQELGIRTVAVYSTRDRDGEAVRLADESVHIGPAPSRRSYLNAAAVLEAAKRTGAQAVHPGYGFLSEDPDFAEACAGEGLVFIGPPAAAMQRLGGKISARALMAEAGLPLLPGGLDAMGPAEAQTLAGSIGYPVILKPSAGGGGKGMTVVRDPADFLAAYARAQATARMLFGDGRVYVEKFLYPARHVEVQILCDGHGGAIHLGARDCTMQRRHQKLVEETPVPGLPADLIDRIGDAAVRGAQVAGYVGAGTFEFLVAPDQSFAFMEVNCRIQVEHPVTEMVTGIDLVQAQVRIAAGEPLGFGQDDVKLRGAAIECRINAEDPTRDFAPSPGRVEEFRPPAGPFVRVDTHVRAGDRIPPDYDSLMAKLVVWAPDRDAAIARMRRALAEFRVSGAGLRTTTGFLRDLVDTPAFRQVTHHITYVDEYLGQAGRTESTGSGATSEVA